MSEERLAALEQTVKDMQETLHAMTIVVAEMVAAQESTPEDQHKLIQQRRRARRGQ